MAAVVHATTVATNAIIEGKTARVGMVVTPMATAPGGVVTIPTVAV